MSEIYSLPDNIIYIIARHVCIDKLDILVKMCDQKLRIEYDNIDSKLWIDRTEIELGERSIYHYNRKFYHQFTTQQHSGYIGFLDNNTCYTTSILANDVYRYKIFEQRDVYYVAFWDNKVWTTIFKGQLGLELERKKKLEQERDFLDKCENWKIIDTQLVGTIKSIIGLGPVVNSDTYKVEMKIIALFTDGKLWGITDSKTEEIKYVLNNSALKWVYMRYMHFSVGRTYIYLIDSYTDHYLLTIYNNVCTIEPINMEVTSRIYEQQFVDSNMKTSSFFKLCSNKVPVHPAHQKGEMKHYMMPYYLTSKISGIRLISHDGMYLLDDKGYLYRPNSDRWTVERAHQEIFTSIRPHGAVLLK